MVKTLLKTLLLVSLLLLNLSSDFPRLYVAQGILGSFVQVYPESQVFYFLSLILGMTTLFHHSLWIYVNRLLNASMFVNLCKTVFNVPILFSFGWTVII